MNTVENLINDMKQIKNIYSLSILKNHIEEEMNKHFLNENNINLIIKIQEIEYKGSGKCWVSLIDDNLETILFIKKNFDSMDGSRKFYNVNLINKNVYLVNTEGTKKDDNKYYLFVDEYNKGHVISYYKKDEVKEIIKEIKERYIN
jgi:hypothetical protein